MPRAIVSPARLACVPARRESGYVRERESSERLRDFETGERDVLAATGRMQADEYAARLVKHIPGEVLIFFLSFSAAEGLADSVLITLLAVGSALAILLALNRNAALPGELRESSPRLCVYTMVAFLAWVLGTSENVRSLVGVSQQVGAITMATVALALPAVSEALARSRPRS